MPIKLGRAAIKKIHGAVDKLFDRISTRYLGPHASARGDKRVQVAYRPGLTLQSLYRAAAAEEGTKPDDDSVRSLVDIARGYLDLNRESTKLKVTHAVESFLRDAEAGGVDTDVNTVLGGHLADIWGSTSSAVTKILDSEATRARNLGILEGITKVNAASGVEDPRVYFVVVRDGERCEECTRVHLLPDRVTPRVWLMSEVTSSYHVRGEDRPSWSGMHPHCRCTPATLMKGYGFDKSGMVTFKGREHDEFKLQRG